MSRRIKIENLTPDPKNHNRHTEKGMKLLENSMQQVGIIESITVSNDDVIISGNARHETAGRLFEGKEPILVETDGTRPVILKRTDIKSNTKEFYKASILANTTAKKNISIDQTIVDEIAAEYELTMEEIGMEIPAEYEPEDPSGYEQQLQWFLNIRCESEEQCQQLYEKFINEGLDVKIVT